jgi:hypothetical protein
VSAKIEEDDKTDEESDNKPERRVLKSKKEVKLEEYINAEIGSAKTV